MSDIVAVNRAVEKLTKTEKLWQRASKLKSENEELRSTLDALVLRVQQDVIPHEKALAESQMPLSIKLLTLGQRKSMTNWERATLHTWVLELFEDFHAFGLVDDDLRNHMARYDAFRLGVELEDDEAPYEELGKILQNYEAEARRQHEEALHQHLKEEEKEREAMYQDGLAQIERALDKLLGPRPDLNQNQTGDLWKDELEEAVEKEQAKYDQQREKLRAEMLEELQEEIALVFDEIDPDDEQDSLNLDDIEDLDAFLNEQAEKIFYGDKRNDAEKQKNDESLSRETFQRLFRATAAKLHPDREPDPTLRDEKQRLMATLLKARKRGDIVTVMELYNQWVGEQDALSDTDEKALQLALEQWVNTLKAEKDEIISASPMHRHVFEEYYDRSGNKVSRAIKRRIDALDRGRAANLRLGTAITSLKSLKPWLEDRFDRERWAFH